MKKKIIGYVIAFVVALTVVLLVCGLNGLLTEQKSAQDTAKYFATRFSSRLHCSYAIAVLRGHLQRECSTDLDTAFLRSLTCICRRKDV